MAQDLGLEHDPLRGIMPARNIFWMLISHGETCTVAGGSSKLVETV